MYKDQILLMVTQLTADYIRISGIPVELILNRDKSERLDSITLRSDTHYFNDGFLCGRPLCLSSIKSQTIV